MYIQNIACIISISIDCRKYIKIENPLPQPPSCWPWVKLILRSRPRPRQQPAPDPRPCRENAPMPACCAHAGVLRPYRRCPSLPAFCATEAALGLHGCLSPTRGSVPTPLQPTQAHNKVNELDQLMLPFLAPIAAP